MRTKVTVILPFLAEKSLHVPMQECQKTQKTFLITNLLPLRQNFSTCPFLDSEHLNAFEISSFFFIIDHKKHNKVETIFN